MRCANQDASVCFLTPGLGNQPSAEPTELHPLACSKEDCGQAMSSPGSLSGRQSIY